MYRKEVRLTRHEVTERTFKCARCGARADLVLHAIGQSGWAQEGGILRPDPGARLAEEAEVNLRGDAQKVVALVKCPTCGQRAPRAMLWLGTRIGIWLVIGALLPIVGGRELTMGLLLFIGVCGFQAWRELGRLKRARNVVVTKHVPGVLEKALPVTPERTPKPQLPEARVIAAPPLVAPPQPAPPPPAPEPVKQRDASEEPAFLKDR